MTQARRVSPRIPYEEAVCLARTDGKGRLYGRGLDLSASGLSLVCADACPIGTEIKCDLLLPHGPRPVSGRIVRVTAAPGGFELAIAFGDLRPGTAAAITQLIDAHTRQVLPARLRIDGVDKPLRCEAHVEDQVVRLTATLPFLRLDGGVDVVLGEEGSVSAAGTIRKIAVEPAASDGIPRLALDVALDEAPRARTRRYGAAAGSDPSQLAGRGGARETRPLALVTPIRLPPKNLPPPCGHPLPSVVVAAGLTRDVQAIETRPPRRRVHGTAEVARRPDLSAFGWSPALAIASPGAPAMPTERLATLEAPAWWSRALWIGIPLLLAAVAAMARLHH